MPEKMASEGQSQSAIINASVLVLLATMMLGCADHSVQTTSGKDYLAKYKSTGKTEVAANPRPTKSSPVARVTFDQALHHVANIEPTLSFPARIGVAKIGCWMGYDQPSDQGLTLEPCKGSQHLHPDEVTAWSEMASNLGTSFGTIIPISALAINDALQEAGRIGLEPGSLNQVERVKLAAARQHLDAVIIYETEQRSTKDTNALAIGDLTLIGAFVLPSKRVEGQAYAAAIMVDPRSGYPYGQIEASAESGDRYTSTVQAHAEARDAMLDAEMQVVNALANETEKAIRNLRLALAEEKLASGD